MGKVTLPKGFDPNEVRHWYLVANRSVALVYEGNLNGGFHYVTRLKNPDGKRTDAQMGTDRPGKSFANSRSGVRHDLVPRTPAHEAVAEGFARRIARLLDQAVHRQECSDLVVIAEPHFLGLIHKNLPKRVKAIIRREVPREWAHGSDRELAEYLREKIT